MRAFDNVLYTRNEYFDWETRRCPEYERRWEAALAGTHEIQDVRMFGVEEELFADFGSAADQYTEARVALRRNGPLSATSTVCSSPSGCSH